jgi:hypothetical protein
MDIRTGPHPERPDVMIMLLARGDDEVELARWHEDAESRFSIKAGGRSALPAARNDLPRLDARRPAAQAPLDPGKLTVGAGQSAGQ